MRKLIYGTLILVTFGFTGIAFAAPTSTIVQNLFIMGQESSGSPCLTISSVGFVTTTTCGGASVSFPIPFASTTGVQALLSFPLDYASTTHISFPIPYASTTGVQALLSFPLPYASTTHISFPIPYASTTGVQATITFPIPVASTSLSVDAPLSIVGNRVVIATATVSTAGFLPAADFLNFSNKQGVTTTIIAQGTTITGPAFTFATTSIYTGGFNISGVTFNFPKRLADIDALATTTGNLLVASTTNGWKILVVGSDGKALVASSTSVNGLSWETITAQASPGGATTQVQYNNGGALAGDANLTWSSSTRNFTVATTTYTLATGTTAFVANLLVQGTATTTRLELVPAALPAAASAPNGALYNDTTSNNFVKRLSGQFLYGSDVIYSQVNSITVTSTAGRPLVGARNILDPNGKGTSTIAANLLTAGKQFRATVNGVYSSHPAATSSLTWDLRVGTTSVIYATTSVPGNSNQNAFNFWGIFTTRTTGNAGTVFPNGQVVLWTSSSSAATSTWQTLPTNAAVTLSTLVNQNVTLNLKWSTTGTTYAATTTNATIEILN